MDKLEIIKNISARTGGEIYLGVVGAVRTGKSTFIKKVIETLVVPNIEDEYEKKRCLDELPQSAKGKMIMTTEPKFVPSNAATIKIDNIATKVRLVDSVGYVIEGSKGYEDEFGPRMVKTPWYDEQIPFIEAAEIGTEKVIKDHSTIGILVTTDGSISDIARANYEVAEKRIVDELKSLGKPFIVILNTTHPQAEETKLLASKLEDEYMVPVINISVEDMTERDMYSILKDALYEFPVVSINAAIPDWIATLKPDNWLKKLYIENIKEAVVEVDKIKDIEKITAHLKENEYIKKSYLQDIDTSLGEATIRLEADDEVYEKILSEVIGTTLSTRADLIAIFQDYNESKTEYEQIKNALQMVKTTGYGVASPTLADMRLDTPEVIKQGSRYGIRLKAVAPSIHMIRVDVESTFEPIIGSEIQSKELIDYIQKDSEADPDNIWKSEIFGRSLDVIVKEGIQAKLSLMPENVRFKLQQTLSKLVNKGNGNLFAIVI